MALKKLDTNSMKSQNSKSGNNNNSTLTNASLNNKKVPKYNSSMLNNKKVLTKNKATKSVKYNSFLFIELLKIAEEEIRVRSSYILEESALINMIYNTFITIVKLGNNYELLYLLELQSRDIKRLIANEETSDRSQLIESLQHSIDQERYIEMHHTYCMSIHELFNTEISLRTTIINDYKSELKILSCTINQSRIEINEKIRALGLRQNDASITIKLHEKCPFINTIHCPFHRSAWIDKKSLHEIHTPALPKTYLDNKSINNVKDMRSNNIMKLDKLNLEDIRDSKQFLKKEISQMNHYANNEKQILYLPPLPKINTQTLNM